MTVTFPRNSVLFSKYFSPKYLKKKCNVPQKRQLYFWITVLLSDDVFGELGAFLKNVFLRNIEISWSRSGSSQFLFLPNVRKNMFSFEVPAVAGSRMFLHKVAQCSANFCFCQLCRTLTNINELCCTAQYDWWKPAFIMFKNGLDLLWGWTLPKIHIISRNVSNEESHACGVF